MQPHAMAQRIELWILDELIPFARNPRTHSDAQITQIAASIAEFGFINPILVDTNAGIIAGHGRLFIREEAGAHRGPCHSAGPSHRRAEASIHHLRRPGFPWMPAGTRIFFASNSLRCKLKTSIST